MRNNPTKLSSKDSNKVRSAIHLILSIFCLLALSSSSPLSSQSTIEGTVVDNEGAPAEFANVILMDASDSTVVKVVSTNLEGAYKMTEVAPANYWLGLRYVGFESYQSEVFTVTENEEKVFPKISLNLSSNELTEVTVAAKKPLLEVRPDKLVLNVQNSLVATGGDALTLLRKAPGVSIDYNDNISLAGKNGVQIHIDDKPSPLSGEELASFLRSLSAEQIESIEIISNPSARYDAEGNAGIINIVLKKNENQGTNTSIEAGLSNDIFQQSDRYLPKWNGRISSNNRTAKFNTFGSLNTRQGERSNWKNFNRTQGNRSYDQHYLSYSDFENYGFRVGADYYINDKSTIGILSNGNFATSTELTDAFTDIKIIGASTIDSTLFSDNSNDYDDRRYDLNLNYLLKAREGVKYNVDLDYGKFNTDFYQDIPNEYKNQNGETLSFNRYAFDTSTTIDIFSAKIDHERPLGKGKLETGAKVAHVKTNNSLEFLDIVNDVATLNPDRSNDFTYTELVNAVYANYMWKKDPFGFNIGLRLENTQSEGDLQGSNDEESNNVERSYTDWFPSAGISYQLNPKNSFQLNFSRRLNRPNYGDLNPFEFQLDELTFEKGNPFLNPEYTNSVQISHTFQYSMTTSLKYSRTQDMMAAIVDTLGVNQIFNTTANIATQDHIGLSFSTPIPITKWWSTYISLSGYYLKNNGGNINDKPFEFEVASWNGFAQNTFELPKDFSLELSGWYAGPGVHEGNIASKSMYGIEFGAQKSLFNGNGKLKLGFSDLFHSMQWGGNIEFGDLAVDAKGGWDSQRLSLNFSYNFGNQKVRSRNRSSGMEDEAGRVD